MGMDISSESGIVFEINEVVPHIFDSFTDSQVKSAVTRLKKKYEKSWPTSKENLEKVSTAEELCNWFLEGIVVKERDYDDDSFDTYNIGDIWEHIMTATKSKLPDASFEYWTSSRISDYEVPIEVPCIVFEEYGMFETKMTAKGKKLAAALGVKTIQTSTWTVMSV